MYKGFTVKKALLVSLLTITTTFTGCASIISGSTQTISFKSVPELSEITITNKAGEKVHVGQTPTTVTLKKGAGYFKPENYRVTFVKEGFETQIIDVKATLNGWYLGNIIFGGLIGILIVDPATGAMYSLNPKDINAVLKENGVNPNAEEKSLTVVLKEDVSKQVIERATQIN